MAEDNNNRAEYTYNIVEHIATISERIDKVDRVSKWLLELNVVSFNGRLPLYDLREWSEDHEVMRSGIRLNHQQLRKLAKALSEREELR